MIARRTFLGAALAWFEEAAAKENGFDVWAFDRRRVLTAANRYLGEKPITITAAKCERSAGGLHDFFSEGDYWWPDPKNPAGPYIQRDGMSNPGNFVAHRDYLMRLSLHVPALVAAWRITHDRRYAAHALEHLRAWFVNGDTRMNPNLQYAQAIQGISSGRGIGIIDTIHLVKVARSAELLSGSHDIDPVKQWFSEYLRWMTTSKNGQAERDAKNNHGTCWVMQVAEFAKLTGNSDLTRYCADRFKTVLVPNQMAADGSFPQELRRTKPYGYSLFNLEAMASICQILSLWTFTMPDGRGMLKAMEFMVPYIRDNRKWPFPPDVMYDSEWPRRQASLLFSGIAFGRQDYIDLWKRLPADSDVEEVIRNFFIRQPVLWVAPHASQS